MIRPKRIGLALTAALAASLSVAGCTSAPVQSGSPANAAATAAGQKAAEAAIAPYIGHPSPFPKFDPLKTLPTGKTVAFIGTPTPFTSVLYGLVQGAGKTMGVKITQVNAGFAADSIASAFNTVVAQKPDAVIVSGIDMQLWKTQLAELQKAGIPVAVAGATGTAAFGIKGAQAAESYSNVAGALVADYVTAKLSTKSQAVIYTNPELGFTTDEAKAASAELAKVCPGCSVRSVSIPLATVGNKAPSTIVADVQSHPGTTVAIFPNNEVTTGLHAALSAAGLKLALVGVASAPGQLQDIKDGTQTVGLAFDSPVLAWNLVDEVAREMAGQKLTDYELAGSAVQQFLTSKEITFDPSRGWTGYQDFAARYSLAWGVKN
ncbi:substrate-binding domain-containing protein [Glaciihabitans sp. UYNi722]|uniref:sugar ABC transporter substrate-binding protein n=1 Tax=Glaciihabitans sp. UYNi722 TaxID=3156344 RepID=UPI003396B687